MGKGSNVQKKVQAQLRNNKDRGKTDEERKVAAEKAKKDQNAFMCELCRQTFMVNSKAPLLYQHVVAKHPSGTDFLACFPVQLKDFDPADPEGKKKAATATTGSGPVKPKKAKKKEEGLDDLLNAGLAKKKGKK